MTTLRVPVPRGNVAWQGLGLPAAARGRRSLISIGGALVVLISGCTTNSHHTTSATPPRPSAATPTTATVRALSPAIPGIFRTGINYCGNRYALNATTQKGTIPLVNCPGSAGVPPTPTVDLETGGELTISGLPATATLTTAPSDLLHAYGSTYIATRAGTTIITVHGYLCAPISAGPQPSSCALLQVHTS
jgi:hypothetical protein